jgi:hypothetical protein
MPVRAASNGLQSPLAIARDRENPTIDNAKTARRHQRHATMRDLPQREDSAPCA